MTKNKVSQKKNQSSIQVIKTLKALMQGDYTMNQLIEILNQKEEEVVFNNSVVSKYINTCRYCKFEIPKIHNKYYVAKIPFGLDLSILEVDLLNAIQGYVLDEMSSKSAKLVKSFMDKVSRFSNKNISRTEKEYFVMAVELFERAIAKKRKIRLLFKNQEKLECIPLSITKENDKTFFNVFNKKIRNIDKSRLSGIEISGQRFVPPFETEQVVVFKLKGNLAKRYEARENEIVDTNLDGTITITNKNENKEALFSRLLRYDDKCEILIPKNYREDMKDIINKMLNNYGVS